jgi:hypothetical protein
MMYNLVVISFSRVGGGEVVELVASIEILPCHGHGTFFFTLRLSREMALPLG